MPNNLIIPELRRIPYKEGICLVSRDLVRSENGQPITGISRLDIERHLRYLEAASGASDGDFNLPSLGQTFYWENNDPVFRGFIFGESRYPSIWQRNFILNPGGPTETGRYSLVDSKGRILRKSKTARYLTPQRSSQVDSKWVIETDESEIPFDLKNSKYSESDIDSETGFFRKLDPDGNGYGIWMGKENKLYGIEVGWNGLVRCDIEVDSLWYGGFLVVNDG